MGEQNCASADRQTGISTREDDFELVGLELNHAGSEKWTQTGRKAT